MPVQFSYAGGTATVFGDGTATYSGTAPTYIGSLPVFWPPKNPDLGAEVTEQPNLLVAKFGDNYSQRSPKGINNIDEGLPLTWGLLTIPERDQILAFFRERNGYQAFWYQLPNDRLLRWICPVWKHSVVRSPLVWSVAASFQRVYDPVS